jgi:23S rRNA (adenine2503-C2)-methyltransferase
MDSEKIDFFNLSRDDLISEIAECFNEKPYRAVQLFNWVYKASVRDINQMTNISRGVREGLKEKFKFSCATIEDCQVSMDGTRKYLFRTSLGNQVESVMIKQPDRMTLCVSSQVGCGMACSFCRTGTMGFIKHLSTAEILQQVLGVIEDSKNKWGDMFSNIVFMGMGEPLHNIKSVVRAIKVLCDDQGLNIGPRKITVSTVGLVPRIAEFGSLVPVNLAVSLNATTDEVRSQIMPINKQYPLSELLGVLRCYPLGPRKKITIEYVMLSGVNDTSADLRRLPRLLNGVKAKVNLIPYNENAGLGYNSPSPKWVAHWQRELSRSIDTTVRWSKGQDINGACGQLAVEALKKIKPSQQIADNLLTTV